MEYFEAKLKNRINLDHQNFLNNFKIFLIEFKSNGKIIRLTKNKFLLNINSYLLNYDLFSKHKIQNHK